MTYALLLHLSLYHNINKQLLSSSDCLASVIPCADTLAVTTGEVSTLLLTQRSPINSTGCALNIVNKLYFCI